MEPIEKFHAHLDLCDQCRHQPHELCAIGAKLLVAAATGSPTGRLPTEPRMQTLPLRSELARDLRSSLMRELGGDGELPEEKPQRLARLHGTDLFFDLDKLDRDVSCPACDMGIPKTKAPKTIVLPYGATLKKV